MNLMIYMVQQGMFGRMEKTMGDAATEMQKFLELERPDATIQAPPDFMEPDDLYDILEKTILKYHPSADLSMIKKAYLMAKEAHKDQKRRSGEPYIIHPICVAIILAELRLDKESIVAGLLHDIVEDTDMELEDLTREFNAEVALLVDGVTKLTQTNWDRSKEDAKSELQAENLRKMFLAMAKDIRVIMIKLADRLHNMRTMQYQSPAKQKEKSRETLDIYSPIASRLGISKVKTELDDWSLRYLYPDVYMELSERLYETRDKRQEFINDIKSEVRTGMKSVGLEAEVAGRVKHLFSIYKKMVKQNKTLDQIYDIFAVRIIVNDVKDCYAALGIIHEMYTPIPGRFKDYIAMPKPNHYQSLHTTLMGKNGQPFEIQIRTKEMHQVAEYGIAAHWKYKERGSGDVDVKEEEKKLAWLREILEWQNSSENNKEFMSLVKDDLDLFSDRVYCFTPNGDVKNLPAGSTAVDFAYSVHSDVGNRMIGAKANGKMVTIDYVIQNGDRMEVITAQNGRGPNLDWLRLAKSAQARSKINQWFKAQCKEDNIAKGKDLMQSYCKSKNINLPEINKPEMQEAVMRKYGFRDWESVLATIGHGGLKESQVVNRLYDEYKKKNRKPLTDKQILDNFNEKEKEKEKENRQKRKGSITVKDVDDVTIRFSKCCSPVPGDKIVGFVTRGRGVSIHRIDCVNILNMSEIEKPRLIEANWQISAETGNEKYSTEIRIYANNRTGLISDISRIFSEQKIDITDMRCKNNKQDIAVISLAFEIHSIQELTSLFHRLDNVESVLQVERSIGS